MERSKRSCRWRCSGRLASVICIASVIITTVAVARKRPNPVPYENRERDVQRTKISCREVSLQYTMRSLHFCGGCVLNEKWAITAAHCVNELTRTPWMMKIVLDTDDVDYPSIPHYVKGIVVHENYDARDSWKNDIALVEVIGEFEETELATGGWVNVLANPSQELLGGEIAMVAGWGGRRSQNGRRRSWKLQRTPVRIVSQKECAEAYGVFDLSIHESQICADVTEDGVAGSCNGDSGGPLTFNDKLVGLVSWSYGCTVEAAASTETNYPVVHTKITEYLPWILANAAVLKV